MVNKKIVKKTVKKKRQNQKIKNKYENLCSVRF